MKILGVETSCDETGIAIVENGQRIHSNSLATSMALHTQSGGIIPENAAREQVKVIIPTLKECLETARLKLTDLDAIAVTYGPGLIGSLIVGVETAKTLCFATGLPLIPTNHLYGHIYASWLENPTPPIFPFLALVVSGGHTDLVLMKTHTDITYIGGTRDDAAGEAFDKTARLLGLPYPGGPVISKEAAKSSGNPQIKLPRPMLDSNDYDFSFSGLKTAVYNQVKDRKLTDQEVADFSWEIEEAIIELLVTKTINAANHLQLTSVVLGGGVSANKKLRERMQTAFKGRVVIPPPQYSTDNGAMIAAAAYFQNQPVRWDQIQPDSSLAY